MSTLATAFYGEGDGSEYTFLRRLVQRTLEDMLPHIEVFDPTPIYVRATAQADKLVEAAQQARGYGLLVFHLDGDYRGWERAYAERFKPGIARIRAVEEAIQEIVPIIPIRMTEAWMLADFTAFQRVTATRATAAESGFPAQPHQVEAIQQPKGVLQQALQAVYTTRRRRIPTQDIYIPLADEIELDLLRGVPAYGRFRADLSAVLRGTPALRYLGYGN